MDRDRVALRYCGGCNPRFDRGDVVRRLQGEYTDLCLEPLQADRPYLGVLVVCGCAAQCAQQEDLSEQIPRCVLTCAQDYQRARIFLYDLKRR